MRKTKQTEKRKHKAELNEARENVFRNFRAGLIPLAELRKQLQPIDDELRRLK